MRCDSNQGHQYEPQTTEFNSGGGRHLERLSGTVVMTSRQHESLTPPNTAPKRASVVIACPIPLPSGKLYAFERRVLRIRNELGQKGYETTVVAPRRATDFGFQRPVNRIPADLSKRSFRAAPMGATAWIRVLFRALMVPRPPETRQVLVFFPGWVTLAAFGYKLLRPETVLHFDVPGIPHQEARLARFRLWKLKFPVFRRMFRIALRSADVVTTINAAHAEYIRREAGRVALVVPDYPERERMEMLLHIPPKPAASEQVLFYMGSLARSRLDLFLRVCTELVHDRAGLRVIVAGDGEDLERYEADFAGDAIRFTGYADGPTLVQLIEEADVCYSDVWSDIGTPLKIIEYMAAGRPVVTHPTDSTVDLVSQGVTGILCERNQEALKAAIARLLDDVHLGRKIGEAARDRIVVLSERDWFLPVAMAYPA